MQKKIMAAAGILLVLIAAAITFRSASRACNIVLITIDTLRPDHLSCYGYRRQTSPNIDALAQQGIRFTAAWSSSSWTPPAMASIMTGLYPMSHGVQDGIIRSHNIYNQDILDSGITTLAEVLRQHGYTTFGAVANIHMSSQVGFAQGFDYYHCQGFEDAAALNRVALSWKEHILQSDKYFLWVHYFDPHDPYLAREPWSSRYGAADNGSADDLSALGMEQLKARVEYFQEHPPAVERLRALYDSEINFVDHHLGSLLSALAPGPDTLIILASDHGEEFLEHGALGHGHTLHRELVHVPLIMKLPESRSAGRTAPSDAPASLIDIMPTVLDVAGIRPPDGMQGVSLIGSGRRKDAPVFADRMVLKTVIQNNLKYTYHFCNREEQLYDLFRDPTESLNLALRRASQAQTLKHELLDWTFALPKFQAPKKTISPSRDIQTKLAALGYITERTPDPDAPAYVCGTEACHVQLESLRRKLY